MISILSYLSNVKSNQRSFKKVNFSNSILVILSLVFSLACNNAFSAQTYYELEIIQPRAGLDTTNRFYKAYPGLLYEVRAAVIGGAYPFKYSLKTAPSGMSIDGNTGTISWASPAASSTPYPVTLSVVDSKGTTKDVSWTVSVTTDKFMFVDPVNGKVGASGTINDPVKGFYDVYGGNNYAAKYSTKNQGYFVYFKSGTYTLDGYTGGTQGVQYTNRQPLVWLAYPGQTPVIEMSKVALRLIDTAGDNFYVDGFDINTINTDAATEMRMGFRVGSLSSNVTFRKNKFHNLSATSGSYNQSAIMIAHDAHGKYWSFQDNEFYDLYNAYGILGYSAQKVLIEDNYFHDMSGGHPIGPKIATSFWFIRHNKIVNAKTEGIWIYGSGDGVSDTVYSDMEVSYNYVNVNGLALSVNQAYNNKLTNINIFRNTFVGDVRFFNLNSNSVSYYVANNVFVNSLSKTTGYSLENSTPSILGGLVKPLLSLVSVDSVSTLNLVDPLSSGSTPTLIDSSGGLIGNYTRYIGAIGWQVSTENPPLAPRSPKLVH
ncbi:MAG: right-handed parallel beta-helix repeat-containing protein [Gammaproteobacteria bacterium]|nr:MAG: right-handed parallel beta-helix repeat-containing protein [Gammaproteobacteria bacterium]